VVREGDRIRVDIPGKRLDLLVDEAELRKRLAAFTPRETRTGSAFLDAYARGVGSASRGALRDDRVGAPPANGGRK
jgi:dihydroxy-acid dehydratase